MEWNDIPRNAKNIFARKALTPSSPKLNASLKESVRGYAAVGLLATALAGVVGQAAFADEEVNPAATQRTADSAVQNAGVVRAHSHFGVAQLGEKASDSQKSNDSGKSEQNGGSGGQAQPAGQADEDSKQQADQQQAQPQQAQPQQKQQADKQAQNQPAPKAKPKPAPKPQFDQVDRWINRAIDILRQNNVEITHEKRDEIRTIIEKESSGDPRAINLWDSNAAKGIPSKGLMQTIDPTFDAHKLAGHDDIYNPVDNIIAGVRYTLDRYGNFDEHPGLASMAGGGDYQGY
ncbi:MULTISPECIES: transglycosylase SLT domain-containing protein [Prauserella salsuginis group]|uniref:Transglycosylase SLT domain-containing protein n=1 Tax=Prauserella salsuginis TaxID=387889 RepID=A0ABW6G581_9PSEU|nr:Transglycosylase SLT domain-containing protein [Prauserella flava]MCR3733491.1 Transglycosylase SLT domain-containing protein [Prauserella salsuginis]